MAGDAIICFDQVSRRFGDVLAVSEASLDIRDGEVLALLGENGAGKSTLMKMLYGIHPPSAGQILLDGRESPIRGPSDAMRHRIGMVFQHFSLLRALSVRDNLLVAYPQTPFLIGRRSRTAEKALEQLRAIAPDINPGRRVADLSVGEQQLVELCKVLNLDARVVILDEPTSVLTPVEAKRLHLFVRQLARNGIAVVLITHKLADVEACADRIAVMRAGCIVGTFSRDERPMAEIVQLMMGAGRGGRPNPTRGRKPGPERLFLNDVCAVAPGIMLDRIRLGVASGEIVGIAGVAGNGQSLLAETIAGLMAPISGDVVLDGISISRRGEEARSLALGYIPEQPRANAVVEDMSVTYNLRLRQLAGMAEPAAGDIAGLIGRFNISPPNPALSAGKLSGGNVQKLVCARELAVPRAAILACYPTMGLDLGAIAHIYAEIFAQAAAGAAVLWISEDLDDLLDHADRIAVLRAGRIVAILDNDGTLTREQLGSLMTRSIEAPAVPVGEPA
jgi:simple sugar transport system ATP-binding protein